MQEQCDTITIEWENTYVASPETPQGGALQIAFDIEYVSGIHVQGAIGGAAIGNAADGGRITSDPMPAPPKGAKFYINTWWNGAVGLLYSNMLDTANGEKVVVGPSVPNQTGAEWTASGGQTVSVRPNAIMGMTTKPTFGLLGDSRSVGTLTSQSNIVQGNEVGEITPSLGPQYAYIHGGKFGDTLNDTGVAGRWAKRLASMARCSDIIIQVGVNDPNNGRSLANMQNDTINLRNLFSGKRVWLTTKPPRTTSTDAWATPQNQTAFAAFQVLLDYNAWARSVPTGFAGCFDIASVLSDPNDPKIWKTNGTPNAFTIDGIHESANGYDTIRLSGIILGLA